MWHSRRGTLKGVSIHAPREGRDQTSPSPTCIGVWFQSTRPVRGATLVSLRPVANTKPFQSTRPVRGATLSANENKSRECVSIHAPREGRDQAHQWRDYRVGGFNPRAP